MRRGIARRFASLRNAGAGALTAFLAVLGPGMLAGLSDDDPAGITGFFHRVEIVLLVISSTLALYIVDGILASPDWSQVLQHSFIPNLPASQSAWIAITATLGTTLAPWGLAFLQSYAVDKKITVGDLRWERVDVVVGSILTGVIGLSISVACAATLNRTGIRIEEASDVAIALRPLAGSFATVLFGVGLLGASLLAAAIVPLATAYSIAEGIGAPASLDLDSRHFQFFYAAFVGLTVTAVSVVSMPGLPLIQMIYSSQVVNAVLLPFHVVALQLLASDPAVVGEARIGIWARLFGWVGIVLIIACVAALAASWLDAL